MVTLPQTTVLRLQAPGVSSTAPRAKRARLAETSKAMPDLKAEPGALLAPHAAGHAADVQQGHGQQQQQQQDPGSSGASDPSLAQAHGSAPAMQHQQPKPQQDSQGRQQAGGRLPAASARLQQPLGDGAAQMAGAVLPQLQPWSPADGGQSATVCQVTGCCVHAACLEQEAEQASSPFQSVPETTCAAEQQRQHCRWLPKLRRSC